MTLVMPQAPPSYGADDPVPGAYRSLRPEPARLFRLLSLHPGDEFGPGAVAALAGLEIGGALHLMGALVGSGLLEPACRDRRFTLSGGRRAHAAVLAEREDAPEERHSAARRVLAWYVHSAAAARALVAPEAPAVHLDPLTHRVQPTGFADRRSATAWYELERINLSHAAHRAEAAGLDRIARQLTAVTTSFTAVRPK